jgi:hypothetical protein
MQDEPIATLPPNIAHVFGVIGALFEALRNLFEQHDKSFNPEAPLTFEMRLCEASRNLQDDHLQRLQQVSLSDTDRSFVLELLTCPTLADSATARIRELHGQSRKRLRKSAFGREMLALAERADARGEHLAAQALIAYPENAQRQAVSYCLPCLARIDRTRGEQRSIAAIAAAKQVSEKLYIPFLDRMVLLAILAGDSQTRPCSNFGPLLEQARSYLGKDSLLVDEGAVFMRNAAVHGHVQILLAARAIRFWNLKGETRQLSVAKWIRKIHFQVRLSSLMFELRSYLMFQMILQTGLFKTLFAGLSDSIEHEHVDFDQVAQHFRSQFARSIGHCDALGGRDLLSAKRFLAPCDASEGNSTGSTNVLG